MNHGGWRGVDKKKKAAKKTTALITSWFSGFSQLLFCNTTTEPLSHINTHSYSKVLQGHFIVIVLT